MKEQNIEQLFRDSLSNLEVDVNPGIWTNIEQGLQVPPPNATVNSVVSKSGSILGKMGLKGLLLISAASVTVVASIIYFATKKADPPKAATTALSPKNEKENNLVLSNEIHTPESSPQPQHIKSVVDGKAVATAVQSKNDIAPLKTASSLSGNQVRNENTAPAEMQSNPVVSKVYNRQENPVIAPQTTASNLPPIKENVNNDQQKSTENTIAPREANDPVFDTIEKYVVAPETGKKELQNAFSPNGDGLNDFFKLETSNLKSMDVTLYDVNGKKINSWSSLNVSWDGLLSNGKEAPEGYYFYTINAVSAEGKICIAKSSLKLIRKFNAD